MRTSPSRRSLQPELLDEPHHDHGELAHSLRQVAAVNRWFGGNRATLRHLLPLLPPDCAGRVLDVGAGNGRTLDAVLRAAARRGRPCTGVAVDASKAVVRVARTEGAAPLVCADGLDLPFVDRSFDAVLCTLTLHHFSDAEAISLLREMGRVCRGGVVVNDLERHPWNHAAARLLSATLWRTNRLTRHDGPLSVLRSFTAAELAELGRGAGFRRVVVRRHVPWRLVMVAQP